MEEWQDGRMAGWQDGSLFVIEEWNGPSRLLYPPASARAEIE